MLCIAAFQWNPFFIYFFVEYNGGGFYIIEIFGITFKFAGNSKCTVFKIDKIKLDIRSIGLEIHHVISAFIPCIQAFRFSK
ncbi:hypothetical protein D3C71_1345470 [compost metagenome]